MTDGIGSVLFALMILGVIAFGAYQTGRAHVQADCNDFGAFMTFGGEKYECHKVKREGE